MNLYAYAGNDPINATDPSGMIRDLDPNDVKYTIGCQQCSDNGGWYLDRGDYSNPDRSVSTVYAWNYQPGAAGSFGFGSFGFTSGSPMNLGNYGGGSGLAGANDFWKSRGMISSSGDVRALGDMLLMAAMFTPIGEGAAAADAVALSKSLASQAQMGEAGTIIAGQGASTAFRDAAKFAEQYGGDAVDWVKKSSSSFTAQDFIQFETHWVENLLTGQRVEFKTIFPGG
jgi:hypothetical protein